MREVIGSGEASSQDDPTVSTWVTGLPVMGRTSRVCMNGACRPPREEPSRKCRDTGSGHLRDVWAAHMDPGCSHTRGRDGRNCMSRGQIQNKESMAGSATVQHAVSLGDGQEVHMVEFSFMQQEMTS